MSMLNMPIIIPATVINVTGWFNSSAAVMVAVMIDSVEACSTAGTDMCCRAYKCNAFAMVPASIAANAALMMS